MKIFNIVHKLLPEFFFTPIPVGIDVGEDSVKIVLMRQDSADAVSLLDYAIIPLIPKDRNEKLDPAPIIQKLLKEKSFSSATEIKTAVFGADVDTKRIVLPSMPKEEIAQALRWEAKEYFLFNIDESMLDFEIIREMTDDDGTKKVELNANIAKSKLIQERLDLLKNSQIQPTVITPIANSLFNLYKFSNKKPTEDPIALIDIGARTTTMVIVKDNTIRFVRQIGCAGEDFTDAMTESIVSDKGKIELSFKEAEDLKRWVGIPDEAGQRVTNDIPLDQVIPLVRPVLERLVNEIRTSFNYYTSQFNEGRITKIVLSGGGSKLKNMPSLLFQKLSVVVEQWEIPKGISRKLTSEKADAFKDNLPLLIPAIGTCLGSAEGINLIPESYKRQKVKKLKNLSARMVLIIAVLVFLAFYFFNMAQERVLSNLLASKRPQWQKLQDIQGMHSKISKDGMIISSTFSHQVPLYYALKALTVFMPENAYVQSINIDDESDLLKMQGIVFETQEAAEVTLASFIQTLEGSAIFNSVRLIASQDTEVLDKEAVQFEISCELGTQG